MDGVQSTEEEHVFCKKHLFDISDDVTQDHDSVLHIQKLISKHFQDSKCVIKNMHEFADRCAGQYKSRHYLGDLSCSLATLGCTVQRNFFATSHAKGEQGAAGSHVKQKATTAVLCSIGESKFVAPKICLTFLQKTSLGQQHHLFPRGRSQCS